VLEYIDGPYLEPLVRCQGPLAVGQACDYVSQVAGGLQCAHAMGMVHRDLKPANLLVQRRGFSDDSPGLVKISDFGLARLQAPPIDPSGSHGVGTILTRDNTIMGTPDFLSPEQARNLHNTDIRSDIYSLGCSFYFLLTGQVPFPGGTTLEKLIRHSSQPAAPVTQFRADVPAPVLAILDKMMAKPPEDRFQTPAELTAALEPYAVSGPIPWAPPSPPVAALPDSPTAGVGDPRFPDAMSALTNTMPAGCSPTPVHSPSRRTSRRLRTIKVPRVPPKKQPPRQWRGVYLAILAGLAVVGAGLAVLLKTML
jgi:serine/threonine-protein kinase